MIRFHEDPNALTPSFYAADEVSHVDQNDVAALQRLSLESGEASRYNLHNEPSDDLHSMVILQPRGAYAQPRKHMTKSKVFQLVSGKMAVIVFDDSGTVTSVHRLAADETLVVRIAPNLFHTNVSLSDQAVYHEIIAGPYIRESNDRVYAAFAPVGGEQSAGLAFVEKALQGVRPVRAWESIRP